MRYTEKSKRKPSLNGRICALMQFLAIILQLFSYYLGTPSLSKC